MRDTAQPTLISAYIPRVLREAADAALANGHYGPALLERAASLLGSTYRHHGAYPGDGFDAWGFARFVVGSVTGRRDLIDPIGRAGWGVSSETDARAALKHWGLVETPDAQPGDLLMFRIEERLHIAFLSSTRGPEWKIIGTGCATAVRENWMGKWWTDKLVTVFTLPPVPPVPPAVAQRADSAVIRPDFFATACAITGAAQPYEAA